MLSKLKAWVRGCEDWWFDATRHVLTMGDEAKPDKSAVVGELRDAHAYVPVRVASARAALRDLPVADFGRYTFLDVGSGKGRMLFVAAELPFRRVMGVEFAVGLHQRAMENIGRYRHRGQRCGQIESVLADAAEFEFPRENLVLYLFNPFGRDVLERMARNIERSMREKPCHVVVVMQWPKNADVMAGVAGMKVYRRTARYHIYQSDRPEA